MIQCVLLLQLFLGFCVCSLCCCAVFGVLSSLAYHGEREREKERERELVALLELYS